MDSDYSQQKTNSNWIREKESELIADSQNIKWIRKNKSDFSLNLRKIEDS